MKITSLAAVALWSASATCSAQNLVANSDFSNGLQGWTAAPTVLGTITYKAAAGSPAAGSVELAVPATQAGSSDAVLSQCISVVNYPDTNMDFYLRTSTLDAGVKLNWTLTQIFTGTGCNTNNNPFFLSDTTSGAGMPVAGVGGTWIQRGDVNSTAISLFPGTKFVLLKITMSNYNRPGLAGRYFIDHVEFGPTGTTSWPDTIFVNGFN